MKHYINQKLKWNEIEGFQPGCSNLFTDERVERVKDFIKEHAVNSEIEINPQDYSNDPWDREYDYEVSYGYINFVCTSEEEGYKLSQEFNEIADVRCDMNKYENGVAYCDFESE
jgi:hypothetical protein